MNGLRFFGLLAGAMIAALALPRWRTRVGSSIEAFVLAATCGLSAAGVTQRYLGIPENHVVFVLLAYILLRALAVEGRSSAAPAASAVSATGSTYLLPIAALCIALLLGFRDDVGAIPGGTAISAFIGSRVAMRSWKLGVASSCILLGVGATVVAGLV
jgi:hypothetical protein